MSSPSIESIAIGLQPLIVEHRREDEMQARLSSAVVSAVGKAGLFRLFAPNRLLKFY